MQTSIKVAIALLVLTVRLWSKLGGLRNAFKGGSMPGGSITLAVGAVACLGLVYYLFEKAFRPMIWRS